MSHSNRGLVEFYISYKLSQRSYPDSLLQSEDAGLERTEQAGSNGSLVDDSRGQPEESRDSAEESRDSAEESRDSAEAVKLALKDAAAEFELLFRQSFDDLSLQLDITPDTAYQSFKSVFDEVFKDGVNWGRIVGLFAFGGVLCVECVERNMSELVSRVADWMTIYLDEQISPWIQSQGGWDCFVEIYGRDAAAEMRRFQETLKKWLLVGVVLLTGVLVGVLIAKKR